MARLPVAQLDGLIIEVLGKDISGAGIDPAISGRTDIRGVENPSEPFIHKITVLDVTPASKGNAIGTGMTDYIPCGLANQLDLAAMYTNAVSATFLEKAFIPVVLPDEQSCIRAVVATCWAEHDIRLVHIHSSSHLDEITVSTPVLVELQAKGLVIDADPFAPMRFDSDGRLINRLGP